MVIKRGETTTEAIDLTKVALSTLAGQGVVIDVPAYQDDLLHWLISVGFTRQRPFIRMYYGSNQNPGLPQQVFAISGPELG